MPEPRRDWRDELARQTFNMLGYAAEQTAATHGQDQGKPPRHYRDEGWHHAVAIISTAFTLHGRFKGTLDCEFPLPTSAAMPTPEQQRQAALHMLTELERLLNEAAGPNWEYNFHSADYALHCAAGMVRNVIRECLCGHDWEPHSYMNYGYREEYIQCKLCGQTRDGPEEEEPDAPQETS